MNFLELIGGVSSLASALTTLSDRLVELRSSARKLLIRVRRFDYENDFIEEVVDIRDAHGSTAVMTKRQQVRFRQGETAIVRDGLWGNGDQLAHYRVCGARRLGIKQEGMRRTMLLAIEPRPRQGDSCLLSTSRMMKNAFNEEEGFFDLMAERPTGHLSLKVLFPKTRPPRLAHLVKWPTEQPLRTVPVRYGQDRRPFLSWRQLKPDLLTAYSLRWTW